MEHQERLNCGCRNGGATTTRLRRFSLFVLVVTLSNIQISNCYSNVRRSGSTAAIEELKKANEEKKEVIIAPMLKPQIAPVPQDGFLQQFKQSQELGSASESDWRPVENFVVKEPNSVPVRRNDEVYPFVSIETKNSQPKEDIATNEEVIPFKKIEGSIPYYSFDNDKPELKGNSEAIVDEIKIVDEDVSYLDDASLKKEQKKIVSAIKKDEGTLLDQISEAIEMVEGDSFPSLKTKEKVNQMENELLKYVDENLSKDTYDLFGGVKIEPVHTLLGRNLNMTNDRNGAPRSLRSLSNEIDGAEEEFDAKVMSKFQKYAKNHVLSVNIPQTARFFGFKFFGLKKLLLPLFIGAQIVKSVLIAMFLPSILGSLGKIVGKGLSQFSGSSINLQPQGQGVVDDLEFKDQMGYATGDDPSYQYPNTDTVGTLPANSLYGGADDLSNVAMSRYGPGGAKVTYIPGVSDNFYRHAHKKHDDYKVFHNIPASSMLLSNYDPFYSPLLSRLDSVFLRLNLAPSGLAKPSQQLERCRERLVCHMYATPAKYAPYSNLVSAQLSRELNELRKPTSDNPEILRFFRYMKAAKDGQEGADCSRMGSHCPSLTGEGGGSVAMITTYNDINKLVSARKL